MVKNLPATQTTWETQVRSLGWEDPLEEEMATHSSILAREIPWTEEPGGLQFMGSQKSRMSSQLNNKGKSKAVSEKGPCFLGNSGVEEHMYS